jgi:hypothetical protein
MKNGPVEEVDSYAVTVRARKKAAAKVLLENQQLFNPTNEKVAKQRRYSG